MLPYYSSKRLRGFCTHTLMENEQFLFHSFIIHTLLDISSTVILFVVGGNLSPPFLSPLFSGQKKLSFPQAPYDNTKPKGPISIMQYNLGSV